MLNYFVRMFMKKVANFQGWILKKNAYFSSHELLSQGKIAKNDPQLPT